MHGYPPPLCTARPAERRTESSGFHTHSGKSEKGIPRKDSEMISREELESAQPAKLTARRRQRRTVRNPNDGRLKENRQKKAAAKQAEAAAALQDAAARLAAAALTAALAEQGAAPSMKGYENMNDYSAEQTGYLERIAGALERIAAALEPKTTKQPRTVNGIPTETPTAADSLQQIRAQLQQMYTDP